MQALVSSKEHRTYCIIHRLKLITFCLLILGGWNLNAQEDIAGQEFKIVIKTFTISPKSTVNITKHEDILIDLRKSLEVILSEEGYYTQPSISQLEIKSKKNNKGNLIEMRGDLIVPDTRYQKNNYTLLLEAITYKDGKLIGKQSSKIVLYQAPKDFEKHLRDGKLSILRILPEKKKGGLTIKGEKEIEDPYFIEMLKKVHEMDNEGLIDIFDSENCAFLPLKKTKKGEESFVEIPEKYKSIETDGFDLYVFDNGDYRIIYPDKSYSFWKHRRNENNSRLIPRGEYLCEDSKESKYTSLFFSPIIIQDKKLDLNSIFWNEAFDKSRKSKDYYDSKRKSTEKYNILLLPFDKTNNCDELSKFCTNAVKNFLIKESANEDVKINIKINTQFNTRDEPLDYETAEKISDYTKADLLLWGNYGQGKNADSTQINVKYYTPPKNLRSKTINPIGETGFQKVDVISSLMFENKLVGDNIKDIVYFSIGMSTLNCKKREKLFDKLSIKKNSPQYVEIIDKLIHCETATKLENVKQKRVLELFEQANQLDSNNTSILFKKYAFYSRKKQTKKAISYLEEIREIDPSLNSALILSKHYRNSNKLEEALKVLDDWFETQDDSHAYYYYHRGLILERKQEYSKAMISYQNVIKSDSSSMWSDDAYSNMANIQIKKKNYSEAEKIYDEAIRIEIPDLENRYQHLPKSVLTKIRFLRFYKKDTVGVINEYNYLKRTVMNEVERKRYFSESMNYLIEVKKFDLALSDCDTLIKYFPNETKFKLSKYRIFLKNEDFKNGSKYLDFLIEKNPKAKLLYERGIINFVKGDRKKSLKDFHQLIAKDTLVCNATSYLACYYSKEKNFNKDSIIFYTNLLIENHPSYIQKKSRKNNPAAFRYSKLNASLSPQITSSYFPIDQKSVSAEYHNFIDDNFPELFPEESNLFGYMYYAIKSIEIYQLEKDSLYEESINLIKKLHEDNGRFKIKDNQKNDLYKKLIKLYTATDQELLAIESMDIWLGRTLKEKKINSYRFSNFFNWVKNDESHQSFASNAKFKKMIKKYDKKLNKLKKKEAKKRKK